MSEWRPGALVMCKDGAPNTAHRRFAGTVHALGEVISNVLGEHWILVPPTLVDGMNLQWSRRYLVLLDSPGEDATDQMVALVGSPATAPASEPA